MEKKRDSRGLKITQVADEQHIESLKQELLAKFEGEERELVEKAYKIAEEQLKGLIRENKQPFIEHPLQVALIIAEQLSLRADAVAAVFLHEASRENGELFNTLQKSYSKEIMLMVEGLNNISKITPRQTRLQAENYRKLIVSYSKDPRVTLIKIADRVEIMRNLSYFSKNKITQKLTETQLLYIPIAHKLGLYNIKSELENLFFKYTNPESYRLVTNKLLATKIQRDKLVSEFVKPLEIKLKEEGFKYVLKVRTKTAWSIWQKMQKQEVDFEGVYDVFAIRFILDVSPEEEKSACWKVYSLVTQEYKPVVNRLRDWITNPKPNGYESLHTTVQNKNGASIEVQIRSLRMDRIAESGHASHWSYKGIERVQGLDDWLAKVKQMLINNQITDVSEQNSLTELEEIFVFTPNGDLRKLPKGATVLDFAFSIHTNIGMTCSGAKVNGKIKPIREKLHTGDTVEIMTSKNQKPSQDWLSLVISSKAKSRIKSKLAEEEGKMIHLGREILERRAKNWKLELSDSLLNNLSKHFKKKNSAEFLIAINDESIDLQEVKEFIEKRHAQKEDNISATREESTSGAKEEKYGEKESYKRSGATDYLTIGEKINSIEYKMSKCCNPIYGDDVFGFVTSTGGISIHRINCPNAKRLITLYPYRIQRVKWKEQSTSSQFQTALKIIGIGDSGEANSIMQCVANNGASIRTFRVEERKRSKLEFVVQMEISVGNTAHLDKVISSLKKLKEVTTVLRTSKKESKS